MGILQARILERVAMPLHQGPVWWMTILPQTGRSEGMVSG